MPTAPLVLITGATDGLGRAVATRLAREGARLILHGRSAQRLAAVAAATGAEATVLADLASLDEVARMADEVAGLTDQLDVLIDNAGIGSGEPAGRGRQVSADGHELRFAVHYLAAFSLTQRLLPLLQAAPAGRIVLVASLGQAAIDWDDVMQEHAYSGTRAYGQSKLAQITYGLALAARLGDASSVTVNSLHPSTYMPTKIVLQEIGSSTDTLERGADAVVRLATAPELAGVTGTFFDRDRESRAGASAYDPEVQRRLWELSLQLTGAPDLP